VALSFAQAWRSSVALSSVAPSRGCVRARRPRAPPRGVPTRRSTAGGTRAQRAASTSGPPPPPRSASRSPSPSRSMQCPPSIPSSSLRYPPGLYSNATHTPP
jgi:hypothetical protein